MKVGKTFIEQTKKYKTPFLFIDGKQVAANYQKLKKSMPGVEIFYAVKANDDQKVLEIFAKQGSSFDIASLGELEAVLKLGVPREKIVCFHPVKSPEFLKEMKKKKVDVLAYDSKDEVDKIAKYAPKSKVLLRIVVDNKGSEWPLTKKFGVEPKEAMSLLQYAQQKGLTPVGLTFHVGSQCLNEKNWISAINVCDKLWQEAKKHDIHLTHLSLGGGIPVKHLKKIPTVQEIGKTVMYGLEKFTKKYPHIKVSIEPGRGLIGDAATLATTVVGKAKRGNQDWIYIDAGVFNGLMETIEGFKYEIKAEKNRKGKMVTIGGPSCDSVDIPFKDVEISNVETGERLYILNSGAYTTVYASAFNGFAVPHVYVK